ncbi:RNA-directed DNA polymerase [Tanacetum coccineum]
MTTLCLSKTRILFSQLLDIQATKVALDHKFTIKDLGLAQCFLRIEICRSAHGTHLNQRKYILDLLQDAGLTTCKPAPSPMPTHLKLSADKGTPLTNVGVYRRLVGRLLYLTMTRPEISYVVQHLSQFVAEPKDTHLYAALYLLRYLKGSISKGLFYPQQSQLKVTGFSDADWANFLMTRRSLTGYCIFLGHALISWKTKKQATVFRSSTEAEYRSMAATTCELLWLSYLLKDLGINVLSHCFVTIKDIKSRHPEISYADLYQLAGVVAIEITGGPTIDFVPGRKDSTVSPKEDQLPSPKEGIWHLRDKFYRMKLYDRAIVALLGAHPLAQADRSGFDSSLTKEQLKFDNSYFV